MIRGVCLVVVVVLGSLTGTGVASANERPLASAGLDQEVSEGAVVYLDAGGSVDPDGEIETFRWEITAPDGATITPACPSCAQTQFRANQSGQYTVSVTVTDDDGATSSDTLYVTASPSEPPSVSVTGPGTIENGTEASFEATTSAGDSELDRLVWSVDGTEVARQSLTGQDAERTLNYSVSTEGEQTLRVRAVDASAKSDSATHVFDVTAASSPSNNDSENSGSSGDYSGNTELFRTNEGGEYYLRLNDNGGVDGETGQMLSSELVNELKSTPGISKSTFYTNTGGDAALKITNEELKEDLDAEAGKIGTGFQDDTRDYLSDSANRYQTEQWSSTSPGINWQKTGRSRVERTVTRNSRVNEPYYKLIDTQKSYGGTYTAENRRSPDDQRVGTHRETETRWQDTKSGGRVVDTRRTIDYWTWDKVITERERVGTKTTTKFVQVERTRPVYETNQVCIERTSMFGTTWCTDYFTTRIRTGTETYHEWEEKTVTEPVYETTTRTVSKRTDYHPSSFNAENIQTHYETEYKVEHVTDRVPMWQSVDTSYTYDVLVYEWER